MVQLTVNGRSVSIDVDPSTLLIYVLRNDLSLNGPKLGCGTGQCGACTVHLDGCALRSCQTPLSAVARNAKVVTLEVFAATGRRISETLFTPERVLAALRA